MLTHAIGNYGITLPFLALFSFLVCKDLLLCFVEITAESYNDVKELMGLHVAFLSKVFKQACIFDLRLLDSVPKTGHILDGA
jgi:hypothetical protein